jgi:hypothetical protein
VVKNKISFTNGFVGPKPLERLAVDVELRH